MSVVIAKDFFPLKVLNAIAHIFLKPINTHYRHLINSMREVVKCFECILKDFGVIPMGKIFNCMDIRLKAQFIVAGRARTVINNKIFGDPDGLT